MRKKCSVQKIRRNLTDMATTPKDFSKNIEVGRSKTLAETQTPMSG